MRPMIFIPIILALSCCASYPDNPSEEMVEAEIRQYTGVDIDLTSTDGK